MAMKTPGVYIVEKNAFPNSVVEVATAVPAFIGYTERANVKSKSLTRVPTRITSIAEYHQYFGGAPGPQHAQFTLTPARKPQSKKKAAAGGDGGDQQATPPAPPEGTLVRATDEAVYALARTGNQYLLYYCLRMFFRNGGGPCWIVSVGNYGEAIAQKSLEAGIEPLVKEQEPTMVVIPETVRLPERAQSAAVQVAAVQHCGLTMKNRFAILDIYNGDTAPGPDGDCIADFREDVGKNHLKYAAAYYPWLNTATLTDADVSFQNLADVGPLTAAVKAEVEADFKDLLDEPDPDKLARHQRKKQELDDLADDLAGPFEGKDADTERARVDNSLRAVSDVYKDLLGAMTEELNRLPPASTMAGIYTMVDNTRGVWKAPANVSVAGVASLTVNITHEDQEDLNVHAQGGKSINAIRRFIGEGALVWGARTLDGNSLDWRYINVRRTMIMLEESIKLAAKAYVFEPNDANTWMTMKSMIENFLTGIWKRGGLAGAVPEDAFSVHVGLGDTMTAVDILEGILRITVLVAVVRPAEFIEITFQQQMQKS